MKTEWRQNLEAELKAAGADKTEVKALVPLADRIRRLKPIYAPVQSARQSRSWLHLLKPIGIVVGGALAGMAVVIVSQSVMPTSWLYPVQKLSDAVATSVHPQYRASVMMKRAQQVNQLVAAGTRPATILTTLADYNHAASAYKSVTQSNYAAFEYCKMNLQTAAAKAPAPVRSAIQHSLQAIES